MAGRRDRRSDEARGRIERYRHLSATGTKNRLTRYSAPAELFKTEPPYSRGPAVSRALASYLRHPRSEDRQQSGGQLSWSRERHERSIGGDRYPPSKEHQ